jgi:phosphatidylglycerophosphatase A
MNRLILLVAQGFGTGRSPIAPGTFGTLLGFAWIYLLLLPRNAVFYILGTLVGLGLAIWIGSAAERILNEKDPGSIVIDEIAAVPIVYLPIVLRTPNQPASQHFTTYWIELILTFALFRLFDIWKPLGIRASQNAPGGLVLDDMLAAVFAAALLWGYTLW